MNIDKYLTLDISGISWYPLVFLITFLVLFLIIFLWGRRYFRKDYNENTGQVKPFNSGNVEEINYNIQSSNLYWGFKKAFAGFYEIMIKNHNGDLNDYLKWVVIIIAFCFLLISGGLL